MNSDMETKNSKPRIIISGGGTGGHIFPAVSIANAIKELRPDAEILFVGVFSLIFALMRNLALLFLLSERKYSLWY